ncbi:MAG: hypothetical protein V4490_04215, partial [Pseudomonadota bacterium]
MHDHPIFKVSQNIQTNSDVHTNLNIDKLLNDSGLWGTVTGWLMRQAVKAYLASRIRSYVDELG